MDTQLVVKILLLSTAISILIKYSDRLLTIDVNNVSPLTALIIVISPTIVLSLVLLLRMNQIKLNQ